MKHASYQLDGQTMSAAEFTRAMQKKYQYAELVPTMLFGYRKNGDKGCKENRDAPPASEYQLVLDALLDVSPEELARLKEEARRKKLVEQQTGTNSKGSVVA
jgi:hypothetical protein